MYSSLLTMLGSERPQMRWGQDQRVKGDLQASCILLAS